MHQMNPCAVRACSKLMSILEVKVKCLRVVLYFSLLERKKNMEKVVMLR